MSAKLWRTRSPLFIRIFTVMVTGVLAAQLLNFVLILFLPPPAPRVYSLSDIASVLRSGKDPTGVLVAMIDTPPPIDAKDYRQLRLRAALAANLGKSEERVRLVLSGPFPFVGPPPPPGRMARPDLLPSPDIRAAIIVGRFTAALQLAGGEWRSVRPAARGLDPWQWRALFWLLGAMAIVAPFAWLLARRLAAPIGLFALAAERLGRDPNAPALTIEGPPEIAAAAAAFNAMQTRLQRYVEDRTTMIAAIAHDLRTPLMRLTFLLEDAPPELRTRTGADLSEMKEMIAMTLAYARDVSRPAKRQRLDLRALVETVVEEMADAGGDVAITPGDDVILDGDIAGLKRLFGNLIGNAVKYAGQTRVRIEAQEGQAVIDVEDDGPGVAEAELDRVFEPFYRIEQSRNRETGGTGLGLASARGVARAHGGDIMLINRQVGGLIARVVLPL